MLTNGNGVGERIAGWREQSSLIFYMSPVAMTDHKHDGLLVSFRKSTHTRFFSGAL